MKIRMNEMTPEGKILNRGEVVIGETALKIVQGMMRDNPYMNDQTETAYITINKFFNEPVFQVESEVYCYAWSDNPHVLMRYIIMCFVRLLLALRKGKNAVAEKMRCGIMAALKFVWLVLL